MKQRTGLLIAGAALACWGTSRAAFAIQPCPDAGNCSEVSISAEPSQNLKRGDTFNVTLTFKQGPDNGQAGGIDEVAAIAFTLGMPGNDQGTPIELADCTINEDGLPAAVTPDNSISNFKVVIENASCAGGRTHCLCPDAGQTRDNFINVVIYGPNPLPTPGPGGIEIPTLPVGPQPLLTIALRVAQSFGEVPIRVFNQVADSQRPQFTAFLSVGDRMAVDQTCVPVQGQPPCSGAEDVSQVAITGTAVQSCVGDCNNSSDVTVAEVVTMVNITLGSGDPSTCPAGDADDNGVQITEIITAVNNALGGCP